MLVTGLEGINTGERAEEILTALPPHDYATRFQPHYQNTNQLMSALAQLPGIGGTTSPALIDALNNRLARIALRETDEAVAVGGWCAEPVSPTPSERMPHDVVAMQQVAIEGLGKVVYFGRYAGEYFKPRSEEYEKGTDALSYMGDGINGLDLKEREPDPRRLVYGARQAAWLESQVRRLTGEHVPTAHEALSLPYEMAYLRKTLAGGRYLLSADLPWIGYRTNHPDGEHVKLLTDIENPVGIKVGPRNTSADIAAWVAKLNPENRAGKLIFMLRLPLRDNEQESTLAYGDELMPLLQAIQTLSPNALIMFDIHGPTVIREGGIKVRHVGRIIAGITLLSEACESVGLRHHGPHLEVTADDRQECVDEPDALPAHPSKVDPQLNLPQARVVYKAAAGRTLQAAQSPSSALRNATISPGDR